MTTINHQSLASKARQVLAVAAIVMGALTSALSGIKLPGAASAVLAAGGFIILGIEHYVSDPSTGTPATTPVPVETAAAVAQPAAPPPAAPTTPAAASPSPPANAA